MSNLRSVLHSTGYKFDHLRRLAEIPDPWRWSRTLNSYLRPSAEEKMKINALLREVCGLNNEQISEIWEEQGEAVELNRF